MAPKIRGNDSWHIRNQVAAHVMAAIPKVGA